MNTDLRTINSNIKKIIKKHNLKIAIQGKSGRIKNMSYTSDGLTVNSVPWDNIVYVHYNIKSNNSKLEEDAMRSLHIIRTETESLGYSVKQDGNSLEIRSSTIPKFMQV